ncbi:MULTISPECIES: hypothetical protein [unclassified Wolbachia]|nr:hypothetical protein [Wolbachia endosymbiont (group A) of Cydia splendana]
MQQSPLGSRKKNDVMKVAFHPRECHPSVTHWDGFVASLLMKG